MTGNSCWLECGQGGICPSKRQTGVNTNIALGKSVCASAIKSEKGTLNSITGDNLEGCKAQVMVLRYTVLF